MNFVKHKNLENFNLNQEKEFSTNIKPVFYSFGINVFVMIRNLKYYERNLLQNLFSKHYSNLKNIKHIDISLTSDDGLILLDSLISNMLYTIKNKNTSDYPEIMYGIYTVLYKMNKHKKRDLNLLKRLLFFNNEIKTYSNKKLVKIYKKTYSEYSTALSMIEDKDTYSKFFNKNVILEIQRNDIVNEFKRRCKIAKICEIVDKNNISQGNGYFIPRINLEDEIIVFFKDVPYTLSGFKKSKLSTKKINGKICWK